MIRFWFSRSIRLKKRWTVSVSFRLARIKIEVETRHNNPPCYWFRLLSPFTQNVRDFLAPCIFSKPSRIHSTAYHFSSSKSSLFSLDCECTHRPLLLLLVIFGEKSSAMKKKKIVVSKTPRPHQVRKEAHFWLFPAITRCDGWRSDLFCGIYRKRRETQKQLRIRKKIKENGGWARERSIPGTSGSFGPKGRYHFRELGSKETWHWIRTPRSLDDKKKMKRGQPSKTREHEKKESF